MTDIRPLCRDTLMPLLRLKVSEAQNDFVAPNVMTVAQATFEGGAEIYGLWDADTPVGMMAIINTAHPDQVPDEGERTNTLFVWRLMLDVAHQRQGHGQAAMEFAVARAQELGLVDVTVSAVEAHGSAIPFYERFGFKRTGEVLDDEVVLSLPMDPDAGPIKLVVG